MTALSKIPVLGKRYPSFEMREYEQAQKEFLAATGGGDPSMYALEPGDYGGGLRPSPESKQRQQELLAQKQQSRMGAVTKLRIETNRPEGMPPPGQTRVTPGQGTNAGSRGTPAEVAGVLAAAQKQGRTLSPAMVDAIIAHAKANNLPLPGAPLVRRTYPAADRDRRGAAAGPRARAGAGPHRAGIGV